MRLSGDFADMEDAEHIEENDYSHLHFVRMKRIYTEDEVAAQPADHMDDLAKLPEVTTDRLLTEIQSRYSRDRIYTLMGDILIALNPFKPLPIYGPTVSEQYHDESRQKSLAPHVYTIAEQSHRALLSQQISQCCVISGESGAGKTETCKMLVEHLNIIAHSLEANLSKKINQVNPLLEAFGNAQTAKNSNSSRFGKYLELVFSTSGEILGGKVNEYLLESSRVVFHGRQETSFHIFYLLYAGLNDEEKEQYYLTDIKDHRYLNTSQVPVNSSENQIKFIELRDCMQFVGFSKEDVIQLMKSLAAVLHIGDIEFVSVGNNEAAKVANAETVAKVATLLQLSPDGLAAALEEDLHVARGEQIRKERSLTQAADARDALAKTLYRRLFSWIVNGINQLIQNVRMGSSNLCLGIFDIFGFENFDKNSFEQLCINLTNEQLQYYFNQHIFALEKKECEEEGLVVHNDLTYQNNEVTLNLFLNSMGILAILDEESRFPKATDHTLATKLHNGPGRANEMYIVPRDKGLSFGIRHYAGTVTYNLNGVLEKNRDTFPSSLVSIMKNSCSTLISDLFQSAMDRRGSIYPSQRQKSLRAHNGIPFDTFNKGRRPSDFSDTESIRSFRSPANDRKDSTSMSTLAATSRKGPASVAYHFKNSLTELINKMKNSAPHFVRCIKPNGSSVQDYFNREYIGEQLAYSGILETIRIRKTGFPLRLTAEEFLERYELLSSCLIGTENNAPAVAKCKDILSQCNVNDYKIGKTRIFLRVGDIENLEIMSLYLMKQITVIQAGARCLLAMNLLSRKMEEARRLEEEREALEAFNFHDQPLYTTRLPEPSECSTSVSSMSSHSPMGSSDQPLYDTHLPAPFEYSSGAPRISSGGDQPLYDTHLPSTFEYSSGSDYSPRADGLPPRGVNPLPLPPRHIAPTPKKGKRPPPAPPRSPPPDSMRSIGSFRSQFSQNGGVSDEDAVSVIADSFDFLNDGAVGYGPVSPPGTRDIEITRSISSLDQVIQMYESDYDTHINISGDANLLPPAPPGQGIPPPAPPKAPNPKKGPSPVQRQNSDGSFLDDILPRGLASPVHVNRRSKDLSSQPDSLRSRRQQIDSMRKRLPPPAIPKRNPETRLSTSSDSAHSQEQQDDLDYHYRDYDEGPDSGHITPDINDIDLNSDPFNGLHQNYAKQSVHSQYGKGYSTGNGSLNNGYHSTHRASTGSVPGYSAPPAPGGPHRQLSHEETFQRQLPLRMSSQQPYYQQQETYGSHLPNGYGYGMTGSDQELYNTSLPGPMYPQSQAVHHHQHQHHQQHHQQQHHTAPRTPPNMGRHLVHHNNPSPPPPPPPMATAGFEPDFPPPPPPLFADPQGSPGPRAPATMPKPQAKKTMSPCNTLPKNQGSAFTTERGFDIDPELAAKLNNVRINIAVKEKSLEEGDTSSTVSSGPDYQSEESFPDNDLDRPRQPPPPVRPKPVVRAANWGKLVKEKSLESWGSRDSKDDDVTDQIKEMTIAEEEPTGGDTVSDVTSQSDGAEGGNSTDNMPTGSGDAASSLDFPVDPRTLDGYVDIPENCPAWKKAMLEKKNKQIEEEARRQWLEVKAEEERWKGVPEWKKKIILEKQKKKTDEECEDDMRKQEQQAKLETLPEWKQNILRKKMDF